LAAYDFEEEKKYTEEEMKEEFDKCFEQTFNQHEDWWSFSEDQLTPRNFTELLDASADFCDEFDSPMPRTLDGLLRNFGYWEASKMREFYFEAFSDIHEEFAIEDEN